MILQNAKRVAILLIFLLVFVQNASSVHEGKMSLSGRESRSKEHESRVLLVQSVFKKWYKAATDVLVNTGTNNRQSSVFFTTPTDTSNNQVGTSNDNTRPNQTFQILPQLPDESAKYTVGSGGNRSPYFNQGNVGPYKNKGLLKGSHNYGYKKGGGNYYYGKKGAKGKEKYNKNYQPLKGKGIGQIGRKRAEIFVRVPNFIISYISVGDPVIVPSDADYAELAAATVQWFQMQIFGQERSGTSYMLRSTEFGAGIPSPQFNVLTEYAHVTYRYSDDTVDITTISSMFFKLMQESITERYITDVVQRIDAFAGVVDAFLDYTDNVSRSTGPPITPSEVRVSEYSIAYGGVDEKPSDEMFAQLVAVTTRWFEQAVRSQLRPGANLISSESSLASATFGTNVPDDSFDVLTEYSYTAFAYSPDSVNIFTPAEHYAIMKDAINQDYISLIRNVPGFENVDSVVFDLEKTFEPVPTQSSSTLAPTKSPSTLAAPQSPSTLAPTKSPSTLAATKSPSTLAATQSPSTLAPAFCDTYDFDDLENSEGENCGPSIVDVASDNPDLSIALELFQTSGISKIFECPGPFTPLIPSNTAFASLDPAVLQYYMQPQNRGELENLLLYHVITGYYSTSDLTTGSLPTLLMNESVSVTVQQNGIMFNKASVAISDTTACNGVFHVLNEVLMLEESALPTNTPIATTVVPTNSPITTTTVPTNAPTESNVVPTTSPVATTDTPVSQMVEPTIAPVAITMAPAGFDPRKVVRMAPFFLSFVAMQDPLVEPTQAEYAAMVESTNTYIEDFFNMEFAERGDVAFIGAETVSDFTLFEAGIPRNNFNILINFEYSDLIYEADSGGPNAEMSLRRLQNSVNADFIENYVRPIGGSFATVTEVVINQSDLKQPEGDMGDAPTMSPSISVIEPSELVVRVEDYIIAFFSAQDPLVEPTEEEYAQQVNITNTFLESFFMENFADDANVTFLRAETSLSDNVVDATDEIFNIYMTFPYTDLFFTPDSMPPTAENVYALLESAIRNMDFLRATRTMNDGGPFARVNGVGFDVQTTMP